MYLPVYQCINILLILSCIRFKSLNDDDHNNNNNNKMLYSTFQNKVLHMVELG